MNVGLLAVLIVLPVTICFGIGIAIYNNYKYRTGRCCSNELHNLLGNNSESVPTETTGLRYTIEVLGPHTNVPYQTQSVVIRNP